MKLLLVLLVLTLVAVAYCQFIGGYDWNRGIYGRSPYGLNGYGYGGYSGYGGYGTLGNIYGRSYGGYLPSWNGGLYGGNGYYK